MKKNITINGKIIKSINEDIYISGQITLDMMQGLKKNRIDLLINNRPDHEDINQLKIILE